MPFNSAVKTAMFTRCNRHCCLCHKQCGLNIEAAHIIDEAKDGSNDEDNGIPLCFDCHQEVGSYNDEHPRGNKFRPEELRARRDQTYKWVDEGKFGNLAPEPKPAAHFNPLHRIINLFKEYYFVLGQIHQATTDEARQAALDKWSSCHRAVWESSSFRDDTLRRLADSAMEWLSQIKSSYVRAEDFDLVEEAARVLSGFAVSPSPMAMPEVYSKGYSTEDELWKRWSTQGERYKALGDLIAQLQELAARAGEMWHPSPQAE